MNVKYVWGECLFNSNNPDQLCTPVVLLSEVEQALAEKDKACQQLINHTTWTTNKPTQPGPYWYKDKEFGPVIVDIILSDGVLFVNCGWGEDGRIPVSEYGYGIYVEWAGPIPEPAERDERETQP